MSRFRLYSTMDAIGSPVTPTVAPDDLVTPPETLISWDRDPIKEGSFDMQEPDGRGSVIETGDCGLVIHDLGVPTAGGTITMDTGVGRGEHLEAATVAAFKAAWLAVDTEWYLTDGYRVWLVVWQRVPRGFNAWLNQRWIRKGRFEYSYRFVFIIKSTLVDLI